MVKKSWNWIKLDGNGLKQMEMAKTVKTAHMAKLAEMVKMAKNGQKWLKMAKKG